MINVILNYPPIALFLSNNVTLSHITTFFLTHQDPHACGEIILGSAADGYYVDEDVPAQLPAGMFVFMLHVPSRSRGGFPLLADSVI